MRVKQVRGRELTAGLTMAAASLTGLITVPSLLFQAGMDFTAAFMSMGAVSILASAWMAYRGLPFLALPSVPLAAWLAYVVIISKGCSWQEILGLSAFVSLAGILLFNCSQGDKLLSAVPVWLRKSLVIGLGLMLAMQGLVQGRLILASPWSAIMLGNFQDPLAYWSLMGLIVGAVLLAARFDWALGGAFLLIAGLTFVEGFWILPVAPGLLPEGLEKIVGQLSFGGVWAGAHLLDFFLLGLAMFLAVTSESWCLWQGLPQREDSPLPVLRGLAGFSLVGAFLGCLPLSLSPLSVVGWEAGGHKGRTVTAALVALAALWLMEPVLAELASFPALTVPLLVLPGGMLIRRQLEDFCPGSLEVEEFLPGLAGAMLMALSFNIAAGVGAGLIARVLLFAAAGRGREIFPLEVGSAILFAIYFSVSYL